MKICIGIISYIPDKLTQKIARRNSISDLIGTINKIFSGIPIIVIAQNWDDFTVNSTNELIRYNYEKPLGILGARKVLREKFLESEYDYLIMLDDDCKLVGNSGEDYLKEIKLHPNGFGWFSNHLLKLFAISKYIYSQIEMPDIDAEKLQGFEDKIFISMCRIRFPELEFEFDRHKLDEISYGDTQGPPSTWWNSNISKHRQELRTKTNDYIKSYAKKYNSSFDIPAGLIDDDNIQRKKVHPVDLVVTYVDSNDKSWQEKYYAYKKEIGKVTDQTTSASRFRDDSNSILYFLRSADKNCAWVNKIFFIVQSESQLPKWLNKNNPKLRIVYHDEYIPEDLLPTFNSNVIEMYLPYLKDLSDNYIVCNDDTFFMSKINREMFFDGNIPVHQAVSIGHRYKSIDDFMKTVVNNHDFLENVLGVNTRDADFKMAHLQLPHKKQFEKYILDTYGNKIKECFNKSHFRDTNNITHWMYCDYIKFLGLCKVNNSLYNNSINVTLKSSLNFDGLNNKQLVCINDTKNTDNYEVNSKRMSHFLSSVFPDRCQYENDLSETGVRNVGTKLVPTVDIKQMRKDAWF